jgi:hypothetical protein
LTDIPQPELRHVADLVVRIADPIEIGVVPTGVNGGNMRRMIPIAEGEVRGPRLRGKVMPGGADYQSIRPDGLTELHARYIIQTDDGALIYVENSGIRCGKPELMERLRQGEIVDPALIYFRSTPRFETAAPGYEWLMRRLFLCSGARFPDRVEMRFFEVG